MLTIALLVIASGLGISQIVTHRYGASLIEGAVAQAENIAHKLSLDAADKVLIYFAHGRELTAYARTAAADGYGLAWTFRAEARILVGPVQTQDAVYVGDEDGNVYRIDLDD